MLPRRQSWAHRSRLWRGILRTLRQRFPCRFVHHPAHRRAGTRSTPLPVRKSTPALVLVISAYFPPGWCRSRYGRLPIPIYFPCESNICAFYRRSVDAGQNRESRFRVLLEVGLCGAGITIRGAPRPGRRSGVQERGCVCARSGCRSLNATGARRVARRRHTGGRPGTTSARRPVTRRRPAAGPLASQGRDGAGDGLYRPQCDITTGTIMEPSTVRVTPPRITSRSLGVPYPPMTSMSASVSNTWFRMTDVVGDPPL